MFYLFCKFDILLYFDIFCIFSVGRIRSTSTFVPLRFPKPKSAVGWKHMMILPRGLWPEMTTVLFCTAQSDICAASMERYQTFPMARRPLTFSLRHRRPCTYSVYFTYFTYLTYLFFQGILFVRHNQSLDFGIISWFIVRSEFHFSESCPNFFREQMMTLMSSCPASSVCKFFIFCIFLIFCIF